MQSPWSQGAWKDVQRAKAQAAEVEEQFEKSRAHARQVGSHSDHALLTCQAASHPDSTFHVRQVAAEHEEMESTLLDVAADLENLARNYRQHGSPAMAVPLYVSALAIFERTLGAEHPQVVSNLMVLRSPDQLCSCSNASLLHSTPYCRWPRI